MAKTHTEWVRYTVWASFIHQEKSDARNDLWIYSSVQQLEKHSCGTVAQGLLTTAFAHATSLSKRKA